MNEIQVIDSGKLQTSQAITADLYGLYIDYLDAKPKTIETYKRALKSMFCYLSDNGITQPTRKDLLNYRGSLKETGHKPTTIQTYITAIRLFFRWTDQEKLYPNIADHLKGATIDRAHKKDYLQAAQCKQILDSIEKNTLRGLRDYAIIVVMLTGGLRALEVANANIEDISTAGGNKVLFLRGKGKDEHTDYIKITPQAERALKDYIKARGNTKETEPLFVSLDNRTKGNRLTTRSVSRIVKTRLMAAGFDSDRLTAHSLRHTAVTLALRSGEKLEYVKQFARHSDISTTMIYVHLLDKEENTCSEAITAALFN